MKRNDSLEFPIISVLIGTYNRSNLLSRCLDSIINQNYPNIEIIVVNDASNDDTVEVLKFYKNKYPNIISFYSNIENKGISYNSNFAYSKSQGDYFALIGDDDEWIDKNKIIKQVSEFNKDKNLGIVSTYWNDIQNNQIINQHMPKVSKDPLSQILKGNGVYCGSTVLISKKAWESVSGFNEKINKGTDSHLFRSIIAKGYKTKILDFVSTKVYIDGYRMTPENSYFSIKRSLQANLYILYDFKYLYFKKPSALLKRITTIIRLLVKLIKVYLNKK
tara:strand:+ start:4982 stop:5809 length:828 start_codon:yes stop_codon:yes gene_type:complete